MIRGVGLWIRAELRQHRRALLLLTVLSTLVVAVVLTAFAGARRTATAYERLGRKARGSHVDVLMIAGFRGRSDVDLGNGKTAEDVIAELRRLPQVEALDRGVALQLGPPGIDFYTTVSLDEYAVNRPRLVEGRLPRGLEEIALSRGAAEVLGKEVGDLVDLEGPSPDQAERLMIEGDTSVLQEPRAGPQVRLRVVGLVLAPGDIGSVDLSGPYGIVSPQFYERHRPDFGQFGPGVQVRLVNGFRDLPSFRAQVSEIVGESEILSIEDKRADIDAVNDGLRTQALALNLFGAVVGGAGLVVLGTVVARQLGASAGELETLGALGTTRTQRAVALAAIAWPVVLAGLPLGVAGAFIASPLLPLGQARRAEPDPGLAFDGVALSLGAAVLAVFFGGIVGLAAWRTTRRTLGRSANLGTGGAGSMVGRWISKAGVAPVAATGLRLAFDPGPAARRVPARSTLAATIFATAAVAAVLVFGASLSQLVDRPELSGYPWDATAGVGQSLESAGETIGRLVEDPAIEAVTVGELTAVTLGDVTTQLFATRAAKGSRGLTIVEGRAPAGPGEAALGHRTLERLHKGVGDTVELASDDGGSRRYRVVGVAAFPIVNFSDYDNGVWIPLEGASGLQAAQADAGIFVKLAPGTNLDEKRLELEELGFNFEARNPPAKVSNLHDSEAFPRALAVFLAVLGLVTLGHGLAASPRRRGRDLALLRVLGFVRRQVGATLAVQATAVSVVALLVGLPLGIAGGRTLWTAVAEGLSVVRRPVIPPSMLLIPLVALVLANLLALMPARRAARTRPAVLLRSE